MSKDVAYGEASWLFEEGKTEVWKVKHKAVFPIPLAPTRRHLNTLPSLIMKTGESHG